MHSGRTAIELSNSAPGGALPQSGGDTRALGAYNNLAMNSNLVSETTTVNDSLNKNLEQLTNDILASYAIIDGTQRIGETFLPSRSRIVDVLNDIRQLLFPGFFGHKELTAENIRYHVGNLLIHAGSELTRQISYCMCAERQCKTCDDADTCHNAPCDIAQNFLARIPVIRMALALASEAAFDGDPAANHGIVAFYSDWLKNTDMPKLFVNADEGHGLAGAAREFARTFKNQTEVTVHGRHYMQEDVPDAVGTAVADFVRSLRP